VVVLPEHVSNEISKARAGALAREFNGKRIVVLGDLMLDEFIWGKVRRISPEAPVPVVDVQRQTLVLGGAGNVASNLLALGAEPIPVGVVGADPDAERLKSAFESCGISAQQVAVDPSRPTTLKTRIIAHSQQVVRADRESRIPIDSDIETKLNSSLRHEIARADALIVSDYDKGLLTAGLLSAILPLARERGLIVCADPKSRSFERYQPVTMITPNHHEAASVAGVSADDEAGLMEAGLRILAAVDCRGVLITRGEEGMTLFTADAVTHIPTVAREVYDVTGAGDTVIATLTLALAAGASPVEAAVLANHAAGVVVGKVGTSVVSREELLGTIA
jgi:D-beta-D-heptose 7-phosphate kinase/D-beta-D-heptose 1-phosphate adenosyltransferase